LKREKKIWNQYKNKDFEDETDNYRTTRTTMADDELRPRTRRAVPRVAYTLLQREIPGFPAALLEYCSICDVSFHQWRMHVKTRKHQLNTQLLDEITDNFSTEDFEDGVLMEVSDAPGITNTKHSDSTPQASIEDSTADSTTEVMPEDSTSDSEFDEEQELFVVLDPTIVNNSDDDEDQTIDTVFNNEPLPTIVSMAEFTTTSLYPHRPIGASPFPRPTQKSGEAALPAGVKVVSNKMTKTTSSRAGAPAEWPAFKNNFSLHLGCVLLHGGVSAGTADEILKLLHSWTERIQYKGELQLPPSWYLMEKLLRSQVSIPVSTHPFSRHHSS